MYKQYQVSVNNLLKDAEGRVNFSQLSWVGLVIIASGVGIALGAPPLLAALAVVVFCLPTIIWGFCRDGFFASAFDEFYIAAWGILVLFAMAIAGGEFTPLTASLVLGPVACLTIGRPQLAVFSAVLGLFAYFLTIMAGAFGWADLVPQNWLAIGAPLSVAALVQLVISVWALQPFTDYQSVAERDLDTEELDEDEGDEVPILGIFVSALGRIKEVIGPEPYRWSGLLAGSIADEALTSGRIAYFTTAEGMRFTVAHGTEDVDGRWIYMVPTDHEDPADAVRELEAKLQTALNQTKQAEVVVRERTAFFAGLGHDLKTPLNAIIGFADLMKAEVRGPLPDAYKDYPSIIHESGQDLMLLVDDILDLAKADANGHQLDLEPVDLVASAASVVRQLVDQAARAEVGLVLNDDAEVWAEADARAVRQIWQNLVSNAIKYSKPGGVVKLTAGKVSGAVALSVEDNGAGMSAADIDRVAKPFTQGANSKGKAGTGLGLAVVHRFAELHGGRVKITSEEGKGTKVRVTLPAIEAPQLAQLDDAAQ